MAKEKEAFAKVDELESQSEYNSAKADLELVKEMITLEDMDLANFRASLEMAEMIKVTNGIKSKHPSFAVQQPITQGA